MFLSSFNHLVKKTTTVNNFSFLLWLCSIIVWYRPTSIISCWTEFNQNRIMMKVMIHTCRGIILIWPKFNLICIFDPVINIWSRCNLVFYCLSYLMMLSFFPQLISHVCSQTPTPVSAYWLFHFFIPHFLFSVFLQWLSAQLSGLEWSLNPWNGKVNVHKCACCACLLATVYGLVRTACSDLLTPEVLHRDFVTSAWFDRDWKCQYLIPTTDVSRWLFLKVMRKTFQLLNH